MNNDHAIVNEIRNRFGGAECTEQSTTDSFPTLWIGNGRVHETLRCLKTEIEKPFRMLLDLSVIDERSRTHRNGQPDSDFSVIYHLLSPERNEDVRLKTALSGDYPSVKSITDIWSSADWYECEAWDMFGVNFEGHPHLRRILMPATWEGHPLRKEHPARATEMGTYSLSEEKRQREERALRFRPEDWGLQRRRDDAEFMFLNLGPQHPGTHGLLRLVLQLDGEEIVDVVPEIGFHHRGAEKMGERQSWHTFIPYTDRVDYLGGVMNNLAYVMGVEQLAGIEIPDRAKVIRIMLSECFRIASHLVFYGTFAQDVGAMSPVFFTFNDRERVFDIIEAVCGGRMHPGWFRIGGVAQDLPEGWERLVSDFIHYFPRKLAEYDRMVLKNPVFRARTQGIGSYTVAEAVEWGVTGPGLRAAGLEWDFRKKRPYSGYDQFEFDVPVGKRGDCYDRCVVHAEEMRQSLRIIEQCADNMPSGPYKADHPVTTPPVKKRTLRDIETLITHFLNVSWGPVVPPGEAYSGIEATKGHNGYYLVSDGSTMPYRVRIRTPSFAHLQMVPHISRGLMVPDMLAILGSIDFVLADVDR